MNTDPKGTDMSNTAHKIGPHTYYRTNGSRRILIQEVKPPAPGRLGFGVRVRPDGSWWEGTVNGGVAVEQVVYAVEDVADMRRMVLNLHYCALIAADEVAS